MADDPAHSISGCRTRCCPTGCAVLAAWGFEYKSNIVWHKVRKDGGSDGRGVGFYFRNVTELLLFGTRGKNARTLRAGAAAGEPVRRPASASIPASPTSNTDHRGLLPGPYLELFGRGVRKGWTVWGNQADEDYRPDWDTYAYNSRSVAAE